MHYLISCLPYSFVHSSLVKDPGRNLFSSEVQIYLRSFSKLSVQSSARGMKEESNDLFCDFSTTKNGTLVSVSFPSEGARRQPKFSGCIGSPELPDLVSGFWCFFLIMQSLKCPFLLQLLQNIIYVPHVAEYALELLFHPIVRTFHSHTPHAPVSHNHWFVLYICESASLLFYSLGFTVFLDFTYK